MIRRLLRSAVLAFGLGLATTAPAPAHPHVFIDAGLQFLFDDQGRLAAVRVVWAYDEFYSLLLVEDRGFDPDGDGALTDAELAAFAGTDVDWEAGFPGDLYLRTAGGNEIALERPLEHHAAYEDGRLITTHIRPLASRLDAGGAILAKVYDPTYFVAYDMTLTIRVEGRTDCTTTRVPADLNRAYDLVEEALYGPDSAKYNDDNYPEVGEAFADEIHLTCAGSS